ncbi:MAG: hypothetical protein PHE58_03750 [Candidatus Omnitrophica bacterium]|nr:hypothetical protein [Candidatus Omnitrophota bacterium]
MTDRLEKVIGLVYKKWKRSVAKKAGPHPSAEELASFAQKTLSSEDRPAILEHILRCKVCSDILAIQVLQPFDDFTVPEELIALAHESVGRELRKSCLEIVIRLKDLFFDIVSTTGDIRGDRKFVPSAVLRSRDMREIKNDVCIIKDLKNCRVEVRIENILHKGCRVTVVVKEKITGRVIKDARCSLMREGIELESYGTDSGKSVFEYISAGIYEITVVLRRNRLGAVMLEIRK